jgi:hypothetical protein
MVFVNTNRPWLLIGIKKLIRLRNDTADSQKARTMAVNQRAGKRAPSRADTLLQSQQTADRGGTASITLKLIGELLIIPYLLFKVHQYLHL